jgi:hypothetical protein
MDPFKKIAIIQQKKSVTTTDRCIICMFLITQQGQSEPDGSGALISVVNDSSIELEFGTPTPNSFSLNG